MKNLTVLGSTGSIGTNTLSIVGKFPDRYKVQALAAGVNVSLLAEQIDRFKPRLAVVLDERRAAALEHLLPDKTDVRILFGAQGYCEAARLEQSDSVVAAMVGSAGLAPTMAAIGARKHVALANKETLVMAGPLVMAAASRNQVSILPIDSEHSAIFQCLNGQKRAQLEKIILTASGGPFLNRPAEQFADITPQDALNHPTWNMGRKISIDSATLMNKGLEVIEARWLFDVPAEKIEVVVHPQSIIHSMVGYRDGSILAQLSLPDMKGAIAYALSFPERLELAQPRLDFATVGALTFKKPDLDKFPCLRLAFEACRRGETLPAVLNAANEVAVEAFLDAKIGFTRIPELIEQVMRTHQLVAKPDLNAINAADQWARDQTRRLIAAG